MKKLKKVLLLGLTLAMSATLFAACGDKGGDKGGDGGNGGVPGEDVKGEAAATQEDWNAAWEATLFATNFTMDFVKTYSEVGEGSHDWCEVEEEGFIKIADGKQWSKYDYSEVWDYSAYEPDDQGEETGVWEEYYGTIDGVSYNWYYEENQWHQSSAWNDDFATGAGVIEEMFEEFDYEWLYRVATYDSSKGAYTYSWEETEYDEVFNNTIEIKIKDGKIVAGKKIMHCDDQSEGYEIDEVVVCSITYGNTEIGKLPGEEGFGEEEEDGNSSELGGSAGGEVGGGAVADEVAWNAALSPSGDYLYTQSENGVELVRYEIDGDTVHILQEDLDKYYAIEEGKYYFYEKVGDQAWTKTEITQDIYNQYVGYVRMDWAMMFPYSEFTYDEASDTYKAESIFAGITLSNVAIKITEGKLAEMTYTMEGITCTLRYTYQDVTLTLPEIDSVGD